MAVLQGFWKDLKPIFETLLVINQFTFMHGIDDFYRVDHILSRC